MAERKPLLTLENIKKEYDPFEGKRSIQVLKGISLNIMQGDSLSIVGPSGSGKSTLLNIMGALDSPTSGVVKLEGRDLCKKSDKELAFIRNQEIGFIFQLHHLLPQCTVLENVLIPTLPFKKEEIEKKEVNALELLKRVGLGSRIHHKPGYLSGGEMQRTAVIRGLINNPKILLADEPTGSLDRDSAIELVKLLVELNKEKNISLVMVTHSIELAKNMKKVFSLEDGRLKEVRGQTLITHAG